MLERSPSTVSRNGRSGHSYASAFGIRAPGLPHTAPRNLNLRLRACARLRWQRYWSGFIKEAGNKSWVDVLVERSSRLVLLAKMEDATAAPALAGFAVKLNAIAERMRQSFTYDQGREMARHTELTAVTGVKVYFCDPHSPWQRGTCENTSGLLRQYLPKGTDLSVHSQKELDAIADSLNNAWLQHSARSL